MVAKLSTVSCFFWKPSQLGPHVKYQVRSPGQACCWRRVGGLLQLQDASLFRRNPTHLSQGEFGGGGGGEDGGAPAEIRDQVGLP